MPRLVIVARDQPALLEELRERYAGEPDVTVIMDRRGEFFAQFAAERDRRHDAALWLEGYVIVQIR
jgi:hypothetical protein